jgi:hypothetical protein
MIMTELTIEDFRDAQGRLLTQSLFLELGYGKAAIYTLKDHDYLYKGRTYPSLKRIYLAMEDPIEYDFATTHFSCWDQWQRICNNKLMTDVVDGWRYELELKLRCRAVGQILTTAEGGDRMAATWIADKGWDKKAGRPSTADKKRQLDFETQAGQEYGADIKRLKGV